MSSFEKNHKKGGSKLEEEEEGGGEKVIYILSVFSGEKSEIAKRSDRTSFSHPCRVLGVNFFYSLDRGSSYSICNPVQERIGLKTSRTPKLEVRKNFSQLDPNQNFTLHDQNRFH